MPKHYSLFEVYGIELEYMLVDATTLNVAPIADSILQRAAGTDSPTQAAKLGAIDWSNELALHVIELKTAQPTSTLRGLHASFHQSLAHMHTLLNPLGKTLLGGGMHPWMNPEQEFRLWPHSDDVIYDAFDRIFDCRGHGWSNLQSMHINLPFSNDDEFAALHAAIRVVLPILPALAASSPFREGKRTDALDTRLAVYKTNARRVPSVSGRVIPEPVFSIEQYNGLLQSIYASLRPHDPNGILQEEWVNARGCIARFDRMAIEIRLLDTQECPAADLAIAQLVVAVLKALVNEQWVALSELRTWDVEPLADILSTCINEASQAVITNEAFLRLFGLNGESNVTARRLWQHLHDNTAADIHLDDTEREALDTILGAGCLAERLIQAVGTPTPTSLKHNYNQLTDCLRHNRVFRTS